MNTSKAKKKKIQTQNVLESLRDLGTGAAESVARDVIDPREILEQIVGAKKPKKFTGEISAGQSIEMKDIISGKNEEQKNLEKQLAFEQNLRREQESLFAEKSNELKLQLKALMNEVENLASTTGDLVEEVNVANMQAPIEPGIYHIMFFQKLLEFVKSYRKKVDEAVVWLHSVNTRAQKKNYWASYKKHGSKFLLSGEHYLTRSAG